MPKTFTLYCANCTGMESNCNYPNPVEISDVDALRNAAGRDYVVAQFRNSYRNTANFLSANCLCKDCDNDHSDNPANWVTPEDVRRAFPDVPLAIHYSRNHMKSKRGKAPRPKFHCILLTERSQTTRNTSVWPSWRTRRSRISIPGQKTPHTSSSAHRMYGWNFIPAPSR